jgi:hypothetical protein
MSEYILYGGQFSWRAAEFDARCRDGMLWQSTDFPKAQCLLPDIAAVLDSNPACRAVGEHTNYLRWKNFTRLGPASTSLERTSNDGRDLLFFCCAVEIFRVHKRPFLSLAGSSLKSLKIFLCKSLAGQRLISSRPWPRNESCPS